jgi:pimeloyl-ACP methyl ester carboxylesterase
MLRVEIDGAELAHTDTGGDGPAVVLVHGLGGSAYAWWAQLAALRRAGYRAIALDQRGAGRSSAAPGPYSVERWAEDVERLLEGAGVERAALVGHSVGCMVAEHAALRLGGRATALALCGGAPAWPEPALEVFEQRAELARAGRMDEIAEAVATGGLSERCRAERPELHGLMLELIASNDGDAYAESVLATAAGSMCNLDSVACPVLAFVGEHDPVTPPALSEKIAEIAPDGESATVPGAAHWCMLEAPSEVNELLLGFLARVIAT